MELSLYLQYFLDIISRKGYKYHQCIAHYNLLQKVQLMDGIYSKGSKYFLCSFLKAQHFCLLSYQNCCFCNLEPSLNVLYGSLILNAQFIWRFEALDFSRKKQFFTWPSNLVIVYTFFCCLEQSFLVFQIFQWYPLQFSIPNLIYFRIWYS